MSTLSPDERAELEWLRARVVALEAERTEEIARAAAAVAAAQERAYWLDRWHLDLNALMATTWGSHARSGMRVARAPVRRVRNAVRRAAALARRLRG